MPRTYEHLSDSQVKHFLERGYVVIPSAFSPEKAMNWMEDMWIRIGLDPLDKSTWNSERLHLPWLRRQKVVDFSPKAWGAICDLLGGEERIDEYSSSWGDSFIINFGTPEDEKEDAPAPKSLDNWHIDGDFFLHFLDSPEQALLVIPVFSKIVPRGGGTYIAPSCVPVIAKWLADHPEGVVPGMGQGDGLFDHMARLEEGGDDFVEVTGDPGDVVLMHPFMLHSASKNNLRIPRVITNPPVALREPFNFNRENPDEFSLVELKTLKSLGKDRYDFKLAAPRRRIVPARVGNQDKLKVAELQRLKEHAVKNNLPIPDICLT